MGKLDQFLSQPAGYIRADLPAEFPWHPKSSQHSNALWFMLLVVESGKICRYGFTSGGAQKWKLLQALKGLNLSDEAALFGVWTGKYRTDLFDIDIPTAIKHLEQGFK